MKLQWCHKHMLDGVSCSWDTTCSTWSGPKFAMTLNYSSYSSKTSICWLYDVRNFLLNIIISEKWDLLLAKSQFYVLCSWDKSLNIGSRVGFFPTFFSISLEIPKKNEMNQIMCTLDYLFSFFRHLIGFLKYCF